ncbi:MAG: sugar ABC transporter permease, partial [Deinococcus sp.]|nr:sugar ABC transporter permease [Deinococcus sp.]
MKRPGRWRQGLIAYLYLTPALLCLAVVYLYPVWQLFRLSTKKVITYSRTVDVGLANFRFVLGDAIFARAILNNLKLFLAVPVLVFLSLLLAALLHERIRGWRVYRALVFLPYVLPIPVVGVAFSHMLRLNGVLNTTLRRMGLEALALDWLGHPVMAMVSLLGVIVWKELGFGVILFLARLLAVRQELYDAAQIDGASWWQRVWHISVPELRPVIGFYAILELITMLSWVFSYVFTITGGGPANSTTVIEFY